MWRTVLMYVLNGTRTRTWAAGMIIAQQYSRVQYDQGERNNEYSYEYRVRITDQEGMRDHIRYKVLVLVLVRPWYDAETRDPRDTVPVRVLVRVHYRVVAVPFILYLVRFCSPKPCKQVHYRLCRPAFRTAISRIDE